MRPLFATFLLLTLAATGVADDAELTPPSSLVPAGPIGQHALDLLPNSPGPWIVNRGDQLFLLGPPQTNGNPASERAIPQSNSVDVVLKLPKLKNATEADRTSRVFKIKHQHASTIASKIETCVMDFFPANLRRLAATQGFEVTVAADPKTNTLIVSAPSCAADAVAEKVKQFDRPSQIHLIQLSIAQTDPKTGKKTVLSRPAISTVAGQNALVRVTPSLSSIFEIELSVQESAAATRKPAAESKKTVGIRSPRVFEFKNGPDFARTSRVFKIRNQPASKIAGKIKACAADFFPANLRRLALVRGFEVIVVAEPKTNSLVVSAPHCAGAAVAEKIKQFDRPLQIHMITLVISQIDRKTGKKSVISRPQITTLAGQDASVQISQAGGKSLEIGLFVHERAEPTRKPAAKSKVTAAIPPPRVFSMHSQPKPRTISAFRQPQTVQIQRRHPILEPRSTPSGRVRLISGVTFPHSEPVAPPLEAGKLTVKRYPISDLLESCTGSGKSGHHDAETVIEFIRVGVEPQKWYQSGGSFSLILLKSANCLVIRHNDAGHRQIQEVLTALRAAKRIRTTATPQEPLSPAIDPLSIDLPAYP